MPLLYHIIPKRDEMLSELLHNSRQLRRSRSRPPHARDLRGLPPCSPTYPAPAPTPTPPTPGPGPSPTSLPPAQPSHPRHHHPPAPTDPTIHPAPTHRLNLVNDSSLTTRWRERV